LEIGPRLEGHLPRFPAIQTHPSCRFTWLSMSPAYAGAGLGRRSSINQLWVADISYIAIASGLVYLAAVLDAWSRRVVGYAIDRRIDARLTLAVLSRDPDTSAALIARARQQVDAKTGQVGKPGV
jgi:transposase InsO family protein